MNENKVKAGCFHVTLHRHLHVCGSLVFLQVVTVVTQNHALKHAQKPAGSCRRLLLCSLQCSFSFYVGKIVNDALRSINTTDSCVVQFTILFSLQPVNVNMPTTIQGQRFCSSK